MTELKNFNWIAIGIPIFVALFGFIDEDLLFYAIISTMLTGLIQILLGFAFWLNRPNNTKIIIYFLGVTSFFVLLFVCQWKWLWIMPPVLCIYLTIIFHTHKDQKS